MKKFVFTLQKLKEYREQTLETEKNKLGVLRREYNDLTVQLEQVLLEIDRRQDELELLYVKGTNPVDISSRKRYIALKQQEVHRLRHDILMKEREIEAQLQVVITSTQDVNTLEKLEENQLEEYKAKEAKENELFIEEFVTSSDWRKNHGEE